MSLIGDALGVLSAAPGGATREGLTVQAVLLSVYVLGALWVFAIKPWRRRAAEVVGA